MPVPARVLLVDDDPEQCESIADLLEALGCAVTARTDPAEALRESADAPFDLVLIDLKLPGMSQLEFLRQIRPEAHRWIVLLVGASDPEETEAALQAGADGILEKPVPAERLQAWISAAEGTDDSLGACRSFCLCER
jgi:CheY-like chemotaxis protein